MFDDLIREIQNLEMIQPGGVRIEIDMPVDDKGYFDRVCPKEPCKCNFKVLFVDWCDKVPDECAYCPKCGGSAAPEEFNTQWQGDYIQEVANEYARSAVSEALGRAARKSRPTKISSGLFSISMSLKHIPSPVKVVLPPEADEVLRQDFVCSSCSCRYSTIGHGYFCPACGHNSAIRDFEHTLELTRKAIQAFPTIAESVRLIHDEDFAANLIEQIVEDQIENLITAMQRVTEALFKDLPNATTIKVDVNLFQRVDDASQKWSEAAGMSYADMLTVKELNFLNGMVHKRHKLGHCQGIVDQKYIEKTGDMTYLPGQRLRIHAQDVIDLTNVLERLVAGLKNVVVLYKSM
ncbi:MAG: hypothetical protein J0M26_26795 [Planctomycetes bacterium]|nr:hypothetical protein [Planctomycetota bacterium]